MSHRHVTSPSRILVIRLRSMGDVILCSSVLHCLKKTFPAASVEFLTYQEYSDLFCAHPAIDRLHTVLRKDSFSTLRQKALSLGSFSHLYDAHNVLKSRWLSFFIKASHKITFPKRRIRRFLFLKFKLPVYFLSSISAFHVENLAAWGVQWHPGFQKLYLPPEVTLPSWSSYPYVVLAPLSFWKNKRWPLERWKEVVLQLLEKTSFHISD